MPRRWEIAAPVAALFTGLYFIFGPIIRSGFTRIFDGLGDVRLVNYSLEHSYRWLVGNPLHADLWSPPLFYPQENVAAYTDLVVGFAAPYWGFRAYGLSPETAYLAWMLVVWTLNFAAVYWLLRKGFTIGALGSSLGAFLFTFASPRSANIVHQQLAPWFFLVLGVGAIMAVFGNREHGPRSRRIWITVFFAAMVLQAYAAIYPLYFFALGLGVVLLASLIVEDWRRSLLVVLRRDGLVIGVMGVVAVAALAPLAAHYTQVAEEVGVRAYPRGLVPAPASWLLMGQTHPWYGWLQQRGGPFFQTRADFHSNGVGPITTLVAVIGLYWGRGRKGVRLLVIMAAALMLMSTVFPGGFTFWRHVYDYLPGAKALRAVGRIGLVLLLPLGLGVALFFERLHAQARYLPLVLLAALMIAEQNHDIRYRPRAPLDRYIADLSEKLDPGCEAFFLASTGRQRYPHAHDDAAWISLRTGIPTVNGRYGNFPPEYLLQDAHLRSNADRPGLRRAFEYWLEVSGLPARRICWIETPGF